MNDMISRQDALNCISHSSTSMEILERIKELDAVNRWTSCNDKMPEVFEPLIVVFSGKTKDGRIEYEDAIGYGEYWGDNDWQIELVDIAKIENLKVTWWIKFIGEPEEEQ